VGPTCILLLWCADRPGITAAVADFVYRHGGNIVHAEQHVDREISVFFQRVEFELEGFALARDDIAAAFTPVADRFDMRWRVRFSDEVARVAILVSREGHCLEDLLGRWRLGELGPVEIPLVVSNHPDHADTAGFMELRYEHLPVTPETKPAQEQAILDLLEEHGVDLVVLARYMQILSGQFIDRYRDRIINIHHSFLPAFVGARPYHQAYARGVKVIGATAHYATEDLDEGPIIEQDVVRVTHKDHVADLVRKGRDLERLVLARAVRAHLEHRVLTYGRKTVVFL
jgi:formyltetrahydrofolate deformylase